MTPRSLDDLPGLRAARWYRESTPGQYGRGGPDDQRKLQDAAIARLGLTDTGLLWEPAQSGSTVYRGPAMAAMLDAARAGAFDVLVVAYVDRWQRNLRRTLEVLEDHVHPAGVAVWFCDEELLSSNDRHWDALVDAAKSAESWLRRHRRRVTEGIRSKRERERDPGGHPPWGFHRVDRLVTPDPERLPTVRRVYELALAGLPDRQVAAEAGLPLFTVRGMLTSPLYAGRLRDGGPANWEPIIEPRDWGRVQTIRARRATNTGRPAAPERAYGLPMLRCEACAARLTGDTGYYRHHDVCGPFAEAVAGLRRRPVGTSAGIPVAAYDGVVERVLVEAALGAEVMTRVVAGVGADVDHAALERIERERDAAIARYRRDRDTVALDRAMRDLDHRTAAAQEPVPSLPPGEMVEYLRDLPRMWQEAPRSRRSLASALFAEVSALGTRSMRFVPSTEAVARGLAAALPATLEVSVGNGRGERSRAETSQLRYRVAIDGDRAALERSA